MKPVLRTAVDKNGAEETIFTPTAKMILYSILRSEYPTLDDNQICERAQMDRSLPAQWKRKYGTYYENWLEEATDFSVTDEARVLDRFGLMQALQPGNFQYWREAARTRGVIKDEPKSTTIHINTDFAAILLACGGNLIAARAKLLESVRGVVVEGRPGMALPIEQRLQGSQSSPGDRTRDLQRGPLEMADSLGADGRRAEQGTPVPAVSEQGASLDAGAILVEREVSPCPQK